MSSTIDLGVNVDHVATLRQARGTAYPSVVDAAELSQKAGAAGITMHLREDRRHIQDQDIRDVIASVDIPVNLEMAVTESMLAFASSVRAPHCCLVPERREELTTEGGLDVVGHKARLSDAVTELKRMSCRVSLFIDPDPAHVDAAAETGAPVIELHTGAYANATGRAQADELRRLQDAATRGANLGLLVHAGHGLATHNVGPVAAIPQVSELNIGHWLIARSVFIGLDRAIHEILQAMQEARK